MQARARSRATARRVSFLPSFLSSFLPSFLPSLPPSHSDTHYTARHVYGRVAQGIRTHGWAIAVSSQKRVSRSAFCPFLLRSFLPDAGVHVSVTYTMHGTARTNLSASGRVYDVSFGRIFQGLPGQLRVALEEAQLDGPTLLRDHPRGLRRAALSGAASTGGIHYVRAPITWRRRRMDENRPIFS